MEKQIQIVQLRLSSNPNANVIDSDNGIDGKLNETSDGRGYYLTEFKDPTNPFGQVRTRVIAQQFDSTGNPIWKAGAPNVIKNYVGKLIAGDIVTKDVEPYQIGDRTLTSYTCVILKGENVATAFKRQGHPLVSESVPAQPTVDIELQES